MAESDALQQRLNELLLQKALLPSEYRVQINILDAEVKINLKSVARDVQAQARKRIIDGHDEQVLKKAALMDEGQL